MLSGTNSLSASRLIMDDAQRRRWDTSLTRERRRNRTQHVRVRCHRRLLQLLQNRLVPILVLRQRKKTILRQLELLRLRNLSPESIFVNTEKRDLGGRIELRVALHAHIRTHRHVVQTHHGVSQPRTTKRAARLRVVRDSNGLSAPGRIRVPLRNPPGTRSERTRQHHVRQIHDELDRLLILADLRDRHRRRHPTHTTIPQRARGLRRMRLDLHRGLPRSTLSHSHQRNTMRVRRHDRLPKLKTKVIASQNLAQLKRVIRPRQPKTIKLRPQRRLTHRLRRPPQHKLRPTKLWRKSDAQILKRLLRVIVKRPLHVPRKTIIPLRQKIKNSRPLIIRNVRNAQGGDILIGPCHRLPPQRNACRRAGLRLVVFAA